jgi:hypothetical protein
LSIKELFDRIMGDVAMGYVEGRATRELGTGALHVLPELKEELSPDAILGDDCVLEIKAKRLLRGILTTGNIRTGEHYIREKIGHGVAQLLNEVKRTKAGKGRGLSRDAIEDVVLCLITPDGLPAFHLAPVRTWVIEAVKEGLRTEYPQVIDEFDALRNFEWLSFDEFDRLTIAVRVGGVSAGRLLRRFRLEAPVPFDPMKGFAPSLRTWLLKRYPEIMHDQWLEDPFIRVFDDCVRRVVGGSIHDPPLPT